MAKIFICYRREDSAYPAQQIYVDLANHFGSESVVFDVDTIPLGIDFREYVNEQVSECDILLAVIGDQWIEILKQRLNEPNDFIRIEIQAALERQVPVVPILVGNASVLSEKDLPPELARLSYMQAAEVRAGSDYLAHLKRLIDGLDYLLTGRRSDKEGKQKVEKKREEVTKTYTNTVGMKFILIPGGSFTMGSSTDFSLLNFDFCQEKPPHEVKISQSFYLQTTQVTQKHWKEVMGDNPSKFKGCGIDCPVEKVSWKDAQKLINKLNKIEGINEYRLPTEAEWEYACRAGTTTEFSFGDDEGQLGEYAWFSENSGKLLRKKTHPVGTKKPNPWGLYDMHGNVMEWVEDDWHFNYNEAPADGCAWIDESNGVTRLLRNIAGRVYRGGSYFHVAQCCRSAVRFSSTPGDCNDFVGFRLAKSIALGPLDSH